MLRRITCLISFLWIVPNAYAQTTWPKKVTSSDGTIVSVYEPQPENFAEPNVTARAAVSIRKNQNDEPVFGVMWFNAVLEAGNNPQTTGVKSITVTSSKFADGDEKSKALLKSVVEKEVPAMNIQLDSKRLNELLAQLKTDEETGINTEPPKILYRDKPTTLIVLDGEPKEKSDEKLNMTRVFNSPYLIVKNPDDQKYYLYGGNFWYSSSQVKSGWSHVKTLTARIKKLDAAIKEREKKDAAEEDGAESPKFTTPTEILVVTEPSELIQTEGRATYKAVEGSTLLYVDNSLDEIFKDVESQKNFILLSGRWYNSASLEGPWVYVPSDALPAAFASIPQGSEKDGVLASVAGTEAAQEAILDAHVPQTAKVDRNSASCTVTYDGTPKFEPIPNTNLSLAENSNITVMLTPDNQYYALENGIWFKSSNMYGPWEVANERPSDVEKIPPGNSAYNTKYVHIYETSPQYVYVGYTPGYLGCYYFRRTVVWGTGWHYRPWYGNWYYPRPWTWGFGMHYNPWSGWSISFGLSFNYGWYHYHHWYGPGGYGWFGPPMYYPPYRPWGWNGGYYGHRPYGGRQPYRPNVTTNRPANWNTRPAIAVRPAIQNNIYHKRPAVITRDKVQRPVTRPTNPITRPTNPSTKPTNPITRPTNPARPVNPVTRPTNPNTKPGVTRPINPGIKPGPTRPSRPVTKPAQPSTKPAPRPITKPSTRPATKPVTPPKKVTKPVKKE